MHDDVKIMAGERADSIGGNKDHPPRLVGNHGSKRKLPGYYARRKVRRPDTIAEQPFAGSFITVLPKCLASHLSLVPLYIFIKHGCAYSRRMVCITRRVQGYG
jgi:hypothetical protein